jgi:hypothetical protein
MPRSFAHGDGVDLGTLEANTFFLVYHGGGFSKEDVDRMTTDEIFRFSRRLLEQKKREKEAHEEALRKAKAAARRRR